MGAGPLTTNPMLHLTFGGYFVGYISHMTLVSTYCFTLGSILGICWDTPFSIKLVYFVGYIPFERMASSGENSVRKVENLQVLGI